MTSIGGISPISSGFSASDGADVVDPTFSKSDTVGVTPPLLGGLKTDVATAAAPGEGLGGLKTGAGILQIAGLTAQAIGSFYEAESQKYQLKSQALTLDFRRSISNINARAAEADASAIFEAGRRRRAQATLRLGQVRGAQRVSAAARGVQAGVGSAAEVLASTDLAVAVDAYAIDANTFRATSAARRRAVDLRNQTLLTGVAAENVRDTRRSISPALQAGTTLLGGAGRVGASFAQRSRGPR